MTCRMMTPFAGHFTVYGANRKPGLAPGTTMSDIAGHYAEAIEHDIGEPVLLLGASTGGSVSLQLAIDRPDLVRRLVVRASACRLSPRGRHIQAELARFTKAGDHRRAWAPLAEAAAPRARLRLQNRVQHHPGFSSRRLHRGQHTTDRTRVCP